MRMAEHAGRRSAAWAAASTAALAFLALLTACSSAASSPGSSTPPAERSSSAPRAGSSGSPSARPAAATGSCSVITTAEASAALGQPVRPPVLGKAYVEGGRACVYYGPSVPAGTSPDILVADSVRVVLVTGPKAAKYFDDYRSKVNAQPIPGLGDQAFYDGYASISVLKGDAYLRIYCGPAGALGPEKKLARDALPRM
jgi:hypothetical protein